ncbi:MAG: Nramp family divalent metal transporter [Pseudomonadota bacterium]
MFKRLRTIGPGALVAAAFVGPGTVTTSTLAGAGYGYTLVWALVFATVATVVLQEMSSRLGTVAQLGLGAAIRDTLQVSVWRWPVFATVLVAIFVGNCAYEAGNIAGATAGVITLTGLDGSATPVVVAAIAALALALLWAGSYRLVERALLGLVLLMAVAFVTTFVLVRPSFSGLLQGAFIPRIPDGSLLTVIALIGTTIVPYNLFLHASAAKARWRGASDIAAARFDTTVSIGLGGLIAILIVCTAAASLFTAGYAVENAADMARQLEPVFGAASRFLLGVGLFAAGLTSAIAAPLATAFVVTEILGLDTDVRSRAFRATAFCVLLSGSLLAITGIRPIELIVAAQFANGLLLPFVACFLLAVMNRSTLLGDYVNGRIANLLGAAVLLLTAGLGLRLLARSAGWI